ncbi:MAG: hypothetical protein ABIB43_04465 [archaeon]
MKKKLFIVTLILSLFMISACQNQTTGYPSDPERDQYYKGSEGVRMLIQPNSPPPRIYYYSDAPTDDYNSFTIDMDIHNVGASWTKGGLYVSGYDPGLIKFVGFNIEKTGGGIFENCRFNIRDLSWSNGISGFYGCNFGDGGGFEIDGSGVRVNDLLDLFGICEDCPEIDVNWDKDSDSWNFNFDFSAFGLDIDMLHHGRALLIILDNIRFDRFNGETFLLAPDNYDYPGGESTIKSFVGSVQDTWPEGLDETDVTFMITSCYAYSTFATPIVCVDPAPFSQNEKVCYPGQIELKGSQGAPVAVTRVLQENTPRSIIFTIEVQNVGNGRVMYVGDLELCSPYYPGRLGVESLDTIILGDISMSGSSQRMKCTPNDQIIKLRDGRGQITCIYDLEYATAKSAYKAPLLIELWYGYTESQRRNVQIKRVS